MAMLRSVRCIFPVIARQKQQALALTEHDWVGYTRYVVGGNVRDRAMPMNPPEPPFNTTLLQKHNYCCVYLWPTHPHRSTSLFFVRLAGRRGLGNINYQAKGSLSTLKMAIKTTNTNQQMLSLPSVSVYRSLCC